MTSRVTQCPKCQTSFRVTDAQLDIANGAVRCGSCLHIFNATEHQLGDSPVSIKPTANSDPQLSFDDSELLTDDDIDIFDDLLDDDTAIDDNTSTEVLSTTAADSTSDDDNLIFDNDDQYNIISEHFADDTLTTTSDLQGNQDVELSDGFLDLDEWEQTPTAGFQAQRLHDDESESEEVWAEKLLADDTEGNPKQPEPAFEQYDDLLNQLDEPQQPAATLDPVLQDTLSKPQKQDPLPFEEDEFILGDEPMMAGERIGDEKHQLLANIEPEPVEIDTQRQSSALKTAGWRAAIMVGLLLLPIQFVYFNFDVLARDPSFRPIISSSCQLFSCIVPELHDISRIRSSNLIVRSHPKANNALVVDAIITNRAAFKQAFPVMELRFTDLNDEVVAGRYFTPEEYLSGELSGLTTMPSQQPVHIALDIVDPGQQAVNYQLLFHQQKPR